MFICAVLTLVITFFMVYPKKWTGKKLVFGVKNRPEFKEGETAAEVDRIFAAHRKQALFVVIAGLIVSGLLLLLRGLILQTAVWTAFIFIIIIAINLPYILGNSEMKTLKRKLGIASTPAVTYTDLSNAGAVHGLEPVKIIIPNVVGFLACLAALLVDLKVIPFDSLRIAGSFMITGLTAVFWSTGIIVLIIAFVIDRLKNEVISTDSAVNANYNRAKKKNFADSFVLMTWINTAFTFAVLAAFLFLYTDAMLMITLAVYMLLLFGGVALFVARNKKIEARYEKEMTLTVDDDDYWLAGMFYYNPKDKRLNVEKRVGMGGTINLAHPAGKAVSAVLALTIVVTIVAIVWIGMLESTPMQLKFEDNKVICHQLRDNYVIDKADIISVELGENTGKLKVAKVVGLGTDKELRGTFVVDGENGCKVFLWRDSENYIKIVTKDGTYYVNGGTKEETRAVYETLKQ